MPLNWVLDTREMDRSGLLNNTKWDEIRLAMHEFEFPPRWRTRDVETGFVSEWDREWFHHFYGEYSSIEYLEIACDDANMFNFSGKLLEAN